MINHFANRQDAALRLANALAQYRGQNPLVLAIPRGGVPMGAIVAEALQGELDVVLVHKLSSPWNPEYAVGAVDEAGWAFLSDAEPGEAIAIEHEKQRRIAELKARRARYAPDRPPADPAGRLVIVVDDGIATGATMIAALHAVRARHPRRLVAAVPVAAPESLHGVEAQADELVCLYAPPEFQAVGQFYREFPQVEDAEVVACLARGRPAAHTALA